MNIVMQLVVKGVPKCLTSDSNLKNSISKRIISLLVSFPKHIKSPQFDIKREEYDENTDGYLDRACWQPTRCSNTQNRTLATSLVLIWCSSGHVTWPYTISQFLAFLQSLTFHIVYIKAIICLKPSLKS